MAVDYGQSRGLPTSSLLTALLLTQFVAFPASLLFGWLGGRIGARRSVLLCIGVYTVLTLWATQLRTVADFYAMAVVVGLVQGGIQSLSRSLFGQFVPADKAAEYFGFFNMMGKFATVLGPVLFGVTAAVTGDQRNGIASLVILFVAGGWLLWRLPEQRAD
jgi:UMF1 family MFS transporter